MQISPTFIIDKWEQLQYPFTRKVLQDTFQDIHDRETYKKLQKPGGFLTLPENTGLILCSDGVQLFKSSNQAFWPILLAVTSLPPGVRMNAENLILAGVWQSRVKPPMNFILGQVLDKIKQINIHGVPFDCNGPKVARAQLLMCVFYLPARGSATNFVQFNGYHSCLYCSDKGQHLAHVHQFRPDELHEPRTKASILKNAEDAEQHGKAVLEVKGKSVLSSSLDIVEAVPVDYMHAVLEGVSRRLLFTCPDSKNHMCRFYLGRVRNRSAEDRQQLLEMRRYRNRTVDKFYADIKITLEHCRVCYSLVYSDKIKEVNSAVLTDACPIDLPVELATGTIVICSKCNTQISGQNCVTNMPFSQGYNPTWWSIRGRRQCHSFSLSCAACDEPTTQTADRV